MAEALERCHAIDDLGLAWIEEPIVYDNLDGYAQLAAELKTPIQIGENFYGPRDLHPALQTQGLRLVMPDFMRIGGVTGWLRAAAIAGAAGMPMSTHLYPEVAAHVMRVTETAHWLEWQDWADPILQRPYEIRTARCTSPNARRRPGVERGCGQSASSRSINDVSSSRNPAPPAPAFRLRRTGPIRDRKAGGVVGLDRDAARASQHLSAGSNRPEGMPVVNRCSGSSFCMPMIES